MISACRASSYTSRALLPSNQGEVGDASVVVEADQAAACVPSVETKMSRSWVYDLPIEQINPAQPTLFAANDIWDLFARLRREDPVHYFVDQEYGPFWSITRYEDIMAVDTDHEAFSSDAGLGGITLFTLEQYAIVAEMGGLPSFIEMDPPKHEAQRKAVSPAVAPSNLQIMSLIIRERAGQILDGLPIGKEFDWVDLVSKELTAMTLATLFDFPFEERRKLTYWSDIMMNMPGHGPVTSWKQVAEEMNACFSRFTEIWNQRKDAPPRFDMISMLAHNPSTRDMEPSEFYGNVSLLIVGGNDTTRNTISGSVHALNNNPDQYDKLRANPDLIPSMVSESIRWQTPLAHMARTATRDVEFRGKLIKKGDRVVMWYISGNRDETAIENPDAYIIDRERPRSHMSFGYGIHRCLGNRLAELQLSIIWEEILKRFPEVKVLAEPELTHSIFGRGYETLPVIIPFRASLDTSPALTTSIATVGM
jgi:cytochrome P450